MSAAEPRPGPALGAALHASSYLSAALSLWALWGGASERLTPLLALCAAALLFGALRGWRAAPTPQPPAAALLLAAAAWYPLSADLLEYLTGVVAGLTLPRLLHLKSAQDHRQLHVLTYAHVTLAANLEVDLGYGLRLAAYMVCVTASLTLTHLRRELEEQVAGDEGRLARLLGSRRMISTPFLAGIGLVATGLCVTALVIFFALPRVGGQWFEGYQRGAATAGFSDSVTLGDVASIQQDSRVAFRARLSALAPTARVYVGAPLAAAQLDLRPLGPAERPARDLYWAGRRLDSYARGRWRQAGAPAPRLTPDLGPLSGDTHWLSSPALYTPALRARLIHQEVFSEARGHDALFALSEPLAFEVPRARPPRPMRLTDDQSALYEWSGELRYVALSLTPAPPALLNERLSAYRAAAEELPGYAALTAVPSELAPALRAFAAEAAAAAATPHEAAALISARLARDHRYSLTPPPPSPGREGQDPLLTFLEDTKEGHCEYFSSAHALALRALGLPARVVTGYQGGEWNEYGGYITVHQRRAHAWVELWGGGDPLLPSSWATYDPTPASEARAPASTAAARWLDQLRFAWYRYVIGLEAKDQAEALGEAGRRGKALAAELKGWWRGSHLKRALDALSGALSALKAQAARGGARLLALALLLSALLLALRVRRRVARAGLTWREALRPAQLLALARPAGALHPATLRYERALRELERAGFRLPLNATAQEHLAALRAQGATPEALEGLERVVGEYERRRFGDGA